MLCALGGQWEDLPACLSGPHTCAGNKKTSISGPASQDIYHCLLGIYLIIAALQWNLKVSTNIPVYYGVFCETKDE